VKTSWTISKYTNGIVSLSAASILKNIDITARTIARIIAISIVVLLLIVYAFFKNLGRRQGDGSFVFSIIGGRSSRRKNRFIVFYREGT
jgi:hypothetical protein